MKKIGFTLAEVLVTLAVIGVVAALTMPSLTGNYQKSRVGPALRKFMTSIENANEMIIADRAVSRISDVARDAQTPNSKEYMDVLSEYLNGSVARGAAGDMTLQNLDASLQVKKYVGAEAPEGIDNSAIIFNFNSGDAFALSFSDNNSIAESRNNARGSYRGMFATLYYDMNGFTTKPNRLGKDIFVFHVDNNGTVLPEGGSQMYNAYSNIATEKPWDTDENDLCNADKVVSGNSCAGSVADNNLKVIYKY